MVTQTFIFHYWDKDGNAKTWKQRANFKEDLAEAFHQEVETSEDFESLDYIESCNDWKEF